MVATRMLRLPRALAEYAVGPPLVLVMLVMAGARATGR